MGLCFIRWKRNYTILCLSCFCLVMITTQHEVLTHCLLHTLLHRNHTMFVEHKYSFYAFLNTSPIYWLLFSVSVCSLVIFTSRLETSYIVYLKKLHHIVMSTTCLIRHLIVFGVTLGLRLKHVLTGCRLFITMPFGLEWPSSSISLTSNASYLHPLVELYRHE